MVSDLLGRRDVRLVDALMALFLYFQKAGSSHLFTKVSRHNSTRLFAKFRLIFTHGPSSRLARCSRKAHKAQKADLLCERKKWQ